MTTTRPPTDAPTGTAGPGPGLAPGGGEEPLTALPTGRPKGCPFDPPGGPTWPGPALRRMRYPDGHLGWLATDHATVRAVLADCRFSSRYELLHLPLPGAGTATLPPAPAGDLSGIDPPEHTRYRRLLTGRFTVRRMRLLTARVEEIAAEHLDAMERRGPGADLMAAYALPVPTLTICELLGVPYSDRPVFQRHVAASNDPAAAPQEQYAALTALHEYVRELVRAGRSRPGDDLLGELAGTDLTEDEIAGVGAFLLAAGVETTSAMLGLGTFALLSHPEQAAALRAAPDALADGAVEELLRYLSIAHMGLRGAVEDVEIGGQVIRAGETVTLAVGAANRDPLRFPGPDTLDIRRKATGHLAFGHGVHQCLGQQLARAELRVALPALLTRFPTLRLAVLPEDVPLREGMGLYGVERLPLTWEE